MNECLLQACYGHTEGTAGVTGALLATGALHRQMAPGITNLREVNPYVEAAAADWRRHGGRHAVLPRQTAPTATVAVRHLRVSHVSRMRESGNLHHIWMWLWQGWR